jgi:hypothetical protein
MDGKQSESSAFSLTGGRKAFSGKQYYYCPAIIDGRTCFIKSRTKRLKPIPANNTAINRKHSNTCLLSGTTSRKKGISVYDMLQLCQPGTPYPLIQAEERRCILLFINGSISYLAEEASDRLEFLPSYMGNTDHMDVEKASRFDEFFYHIFVSCGYHLNNLTAARESNRSGRKSLRLGWTGRHTSWLVPTGDWTRYLLKRKIYCT